MATSYSGIELARGLFLDVVRPLLAREFPALRYAAGRLGSGSDVLGLDDGTSQDHDWGCRLTVLLDAEDAGLAPVLDEFLDRELPPEYRGHPIRMAMTWDPQVRHRVHVVTVGDFAASRLGVDPTRGMSTVDWLTLPGHSVLEVVAGPLFVDDTRQAGPLRELLRWYPPDLDRYVLVAGWDGLARHVHFHGRIGERGQDLQSRVLAGAMAAELFRLGFLVCRSWPTYDKWVEARFRDLPVAPAMTGPLRTLLDSPDWREREQAVADAVDVLLAAQRGRGLPAPEVGLVRFFNRAMRMLAAEVTDGLLAGITDPEVLALPARLGTIEQWAVRHDVVFRLERRPALADAYRAWIEVPGRMPTG